MQNSHSSSLTLELVTPERLLASREAGMVVVPAADGELGVLPHHAPVITVLKDGVVTIHADRNAASDQRFYVIGGFAEVSGESCTLLAEKAFDLEKTDRTEIQSARDALVEKLDDLRYKKAPQHKINNTEQMIAAYEQLLALL